MKTHRYVMVMFIDEMVDTTVLWVQTVSVGDYFVTRFLPSLSKAYTYIHTYKQGWATRCNLVAVC